MLRKLIAIDPSLTASGWALFDLESARPIQYGLIRPPGTELGLSARYEWLQQQVTILLSEIRVSPKDYLICEGPAPLVKNPESALRVERVRSIFEAVGRMRQMIIVDRLNPRTVQSELLGLRGAQLKRDVVKGIAREAVLRMFERELSDAKEKLSQDIVDALLVGALATSRVQMHIKTGVPLEMLFQPKLSSKKNSRERYQGWRVSNR